MTACIDTLQTSVSGDSIRQRHDANPMNPAAFRHFRRNGALAAAFLSPFFFLSSSAPANGGAVEKAVAEAVRKTQESLVSGDDFSKKAFEALDRKALRAAAEKGDPEACYLLGCIHDSRIGVLDDDKEAVKWYRRAAEQGMASAQVELGTMCLGGEGVPKNLDKARKWLGKAAAQGHPGAKKFLEEIE